MQLHLTEIIHCRACFFFLFPCSSKSTVASEAACKLNSRLHINPLQNRVSPETEGVFNDTFWEGLDLVVNALDNVNARLYVDSRYVLGDGGVL